MHPAAEHSPLGKSSEYIATYSPEQLFPIPRTAKWAEPGRHRADPALAGRGLLELF